MKKYSKTYLPPEKYIEEYLEAMSFLETRYPHLDLLEESRKHGLQWTFYESTDLRRSAFYPVRSMFEAKIRNRPMILINSARSRWGTYRRKSIGMYAPFVQVGSSLQTVCAIIHEFTHFIQRCVDGRDASEVETSENELQYMFEHHNHHFQKVRILVDGRRKIRNKRIICSVTKPKGL